MKSTLFIVFLWPVVSKAFHLRPGNSIPQEISSGVIDVHIPREYHDNTNRDSFTSKVNLDHLSSTPTSRTPRTVSHRLSKRTDKPAMQSTEADRLRKARTRIEILGIADISRPSKAPFGPMSDARRSFEQDRTASRIPRLSHSSQIQNAKTRVEVLGLSRIPRPSRIPPPSLSNARPSTQRESTASSMVDLATSSRIPRLSQTQQTSASLQHQSDESRPSALKPTRPWKSNKVPTNFSQDPTVKRLAQHSPPSGRVISRPKSNKSLEQVAEAKQKTYPTAILPSPGLNMHDQPKLSVEPSGREPKLLSQTLQTSNSMDVIGIPPGLAKIKVESNQRDGLYDQTYSPTGPYSGAYFHHMSMLGPTRPPGLPKAPARP